MTVTMTLEEENRILRVTFISPWTADEMVRNFPQAKQWYDDATHPIHMLIDMRQNRYAPPGALRAREAPGLTHPKAGIAAVFGASTLIRMLGEVVMRVARSENLKFFDTEALALAYLRGVIAAEHPQPATPLSEAEKSPV
ncbi:MAG TPA: hypothetical protein PLD47_12230 [Aggregatilineales bacterium]|nr:STAS/SEC14 domain-containing protein [Anaerolineales bacterium]HRE48484.1 hypothetical protein [Aggregatilineales bacterium]